MHITCPACTTSYAATPQALGEAGRKVKCHKCGNVWFASAEDLAEPASAAPVNDGDDDMHMEDAQQSATEDAGESDASDLDFEDLEGDTDADGVEMSSTDAEADAAWESVLADVGLQDGTGIDDDTDVLDMLDHPHRAREAALQKARGEDIESLAARRGEGAGKKGRLIDFGPGSRMAGFGKVAAIAAAFILGLAGATAGLYLGRDSVVSALPGAARLYAAAGYPVNLRGLEFVNVTFEQGVENGLSVLAIRGEVMNITDAALPVPEIRFALRNDSDLEIYHWTGKAQALELPPAGKAPFLTRLATPPATAASVQVRFVGRAKSGGRT